MDDLRMAVAAVLAETPHKLVLSAPRDKQSKEKRATLTPIDNGRWQVERLRGTQAVHQNIPAAALQDTVCALLGQQFTQLTSLSAHRQSSLRVTAKGRVLHTGKAAQTQPPPRPVGHDRPKNYILAEGTDIPPLRDMGIFTAEGRVAASMQGKYRQIERFVQLVDDALRGKDPKSLRVVDFGCGKSYLTFVLYHYLRHIRGIPVQMEGLDLKEDVVAACNAAAQKYGYDSLHFGVGDIAAYHSSAPVDMVVTLHACDTATDHALAAAVGWGTQYIFSVPCCQHELNAQIKSEELSILTRYGIVKERTAALMTDALRANLLAACGYKTQLVEFVDFEHTPKNILIRAVKTNMPSAQEQRALQEVQDLCRAFSLQPTLLQLLRQAGLL